jgi:hypothetical protein
MLHPIGLPGAARGRADVVPWHSCEQIPERNVTWWVAALRIRWRRVKVGLVRMAGALGFGEGVVNFEDSVLGAVVVVGGFILALYNWEGIHNVASVACAVRTK